MRSSPLQKSKAKLFVTAFQSADLTDKVTKVTNGSFDQWLTTIENHRHSIDRTNKGSTIGIQSMAMVGSEKTTYHSIGNNCQLKITIDQWLFHRPKNFTTGQAYQSVMILQTKLKFCLVYLLPTPSHCIQVSPGFHPHLRACVTSLGRWLPQP